MSVESSGRYIRISANVLGCYVLLPPVRNQELTGRRVKAKKWGCPDGWRKEEF